MLPPPILSSPGTQKKIQKNRGTRNGKVMGTLQLKLTHLGEQGIIHQEKHFLRYKLYTDYVTGPISIIQTWIVYQMSGMWGISQLVRSLNCWEKKTVHKVVPCQKQVKRIWILRCNMFTHHLLSSSETILQARPMMMLGSSSSIEWTMIKWHFDGRWYLQDPYRVRMPIWYAYRSAQARFILY